MPGAHPLPCCYASGILTAFSSSRGLSKFPLATGGGPSSISAIKSTSISSVRHEGFVCATLVAAKITYGICATLLAGGMYVRSGRAGSAEINWPNRICNNGARETLCGLGRRSGDTGRAEGDQRCHSFARAPFGQDVGSERNASNQGRGFGGRYWFGRRVRTPPALVLGSATLTARS
jgi:hypothetical protein